MSGTSIRPYLTIILILGVLGMAPSARAGSPELILLDEAITLNAQLVLLEQDFTEGLIELPILIDRLDELEEDHDRIVGERLELPIECPCSTLDATIVRNDLIITALGGYSGGFDDSSARPELGLEQGAPESQTSTGRRQPITYLRVQSGS